MKVIVHRPHFYNERKRPVIHPEPKLGRAGQRQIQPNPFRAGLDVNERLVIIQGECACKCLPSTHADNPASEPLIINFLRFEIYAYTQH